MADVSLDDYIQRKGSNFRVQISNTTTGNKNTARFQAKPQQAGTAMRQQKGSFNKNRLQFNKNGQGAQNQQVKPISVTVGFNKGQFDARDKLAQKNRPVDAREKLAAKARQTDARFKILKSKAIKSGVLNPSNVKTNDARARIAARQNVNQGKLVQVTLGGAASNNQMEGGVQRVELSEGGLTRRIQNNNISTGGMPGNFKITRNNNTNTGGMPADFQITRTQVNPGFRKGSGIQMSGNNMMITRPVDPVIPQSNPVMTKIVSDFSPQSYESPMVSLNSSSSPVVQVTNDQYQLTSHTGYHVTPDNTYYEEFEEEEEEEEYYESPETEITRPTTYFVEKTLTVKKPQLLLSRSTPAANKSTVVSLKRPDPVKTNTISQSRPAVNVPVKRKAPVASSPGPLKLAKTSLSTTETTLPTQRLKVLKTEVQSSQPEYIEEEVAESQVKTPSTAQGFRVIVSNLHTVVTQDDIIELFGAIGPMKRARLLKKSMAEVVYIKKVDAQKAIQKYHNRELDGQPMYVKLYVPPAPVKKEPPEAVLGDTKDVQGPLRLGKGGPKKSSDLEVNVLHKALFKIGAPTSSKPVTFTVKV